MLQYMNKKQSLDQINRNKIKIIMFFIIIFISIIFLDYFLL